MTRAQPGSDPQWVHFSELAMNGSLRIELGPCDDNGELIINGSSAMILGLGEVRTAVRQFPDGDYDVRLNVVNSGGWAWAAKLRLIANGNERVAVDEGGGTGLWTGTVFHRGWQFTVKDGQFSDFAAV